MDRVQRVGVSRIKVNDEVRPRETISRTLVAEYKVAYEEAAPMPPIVLFRDGEAYWLADGWHRYEAQRAIGAVELPALVHDGDKADAMLYAAGSNTTHGRRREKGDAVRAAKVAIRALRLKHPRTRPTYEAVREAAHVGTETVVKAFEEMEEDGEEVGEKSPAGRPARNITPVISTPPPVSLTIHADPDAEESPTAPWDPEPDDPDWTDGEEEEPAYARPPTPEPRAAARPTIRQPTEADRARVVAFNRLVHARDDIATALAYGGASHDGDRDDIPRQWAECAALARAILDIIAARFPDAETGESHEDGTAGGS